MEMMRSLLSLLMCLLLGSMAEEWKCPRDTGTFADPETCRRFYTCDNGKPFRSLCPSGLYWHDVRKLCTYREEAVCGPVDAKESEDDKDGKEDNDQQDQQPTAQRCDEDLCQLPYCFCSRRGNRTPMPRSSLPRVPQLVLLTLDGAVNNNNFEHYLDLLSPDRNSNYSGTVRATFFLEHEYCNYFMVEQLHAMGHEMALSSLNGKSLQTANSSLWLRHLVSQKRMLSKYANVGEEEILGMRAPGIMPGGEAQFDALVEAGLIWDSSVSTLPLDTPVWPYTLDYAIGHKCKLAQCPRQAYPGLWELPLNSHYVADGTGGQCSFLDQCVFTFLTSDDIFEWLKEDFQRHLTTNKAPYLMSMHTNWFLHEHQANGLRKFVQWATSTTDHDIHFVTVTEALLWLTDDNINEDKFNFQHLPLPNIDLTCNEPDVCPLPYTDEDGTSTLRYLATCAECPDSYPWLSDLEDVIEDVNE